MRLDPPLDPTADQARSWLTTELARGEYAFHESLWHRFTTWLGDLMDRLLNTGSGTSGSVVGTSAWLIGSLVVLGALFLISRSVGFGRGHRRGGAGPSGVLDGDARSAREHRREASDAFAAGDYDQAVLAAYRAIARAAIERTVLDDQPGRTAHEVAIGLAPAFPTLADDALASSHAFDAVRYGHQRASREDAAQVLDTDRRMASTRPTFDEIPAAT